MSAPTPAASPTATATGRSRATAAATAPTAIRQKLIVLCDGTWCGSETNTKSNIFLLAKMIGIPMDEENPTNAVPIYYEDPTREIQAGYFPGSGLGSTFLEYLYNATSGMDIDNDCIRVYKYIVERYTGYQEIWMFGLSRGSYTVRSVVGMINNCGLIRTFTDRTIDSLCNEVYLIYRSPYPEDCPKSRSSLEFRRRVSHNVSMPIKFMGLLDTVGAMGVPKLDSGIGLTFPEFHDHMISSEVEKVYHACAIHDRLWIFQPCRAFRKPNPDKPWLQVHERWFPGCHYDLGRQRFRFFPNGKDVIQRSIGRALRPLGKVIEPNEVLADLVLKWMLESIKSENPHGNVITNIDGEIHTLNTNIRESPKTGSGDVYDNILEYGPGGRLFEVGARIADAAVTFLDRLSQARLGTALRDFFDLRLIIGTIAATRHRRIGDYAAVVTMYDEASNTTGDQTIATLARIDKRRYPSNTFENFRKYSTAMREGPPIPQGSVLHDIM
ncbi:hypothetical protein BGZ70_006540 [Mortierella alpina]|uniref:T6SS Phospholipase effector Tle1-like catalytic domain-containing protein n=1 Tax=Mortierella alpina TaxID=64518 RepID=A0A9P6J844_MORAP|nr:hypothetical protein BGZ70_006540 [Mortierella alpina]